MACQLHCICALERNRVDQANAFPMKQQSGLGDSVAAAFRRVFPKRGARTPAGDSPFWTSGVTYRGYLGVSGGVSSAWVTEHQLRETQALLRMAAAAGRLGAWSVELSGNHWVWSDEVKAIHEVGDDFEPNTENALAFYEPHYQELAVSAFEQCGKHGTPFDLELQMRTARGRSVWIRCIGDAEVDAEGNITHLRGAIQDITKAREASDEVKRMAERFTRTLESLSDGFVLLDHDWCFLYMNPEAERILRRKRDDVLGKCMLTQFPETASGKFLEKCQDAIRDGHTVEFTKFYPPLGMWVYFKVWPTEQGLTFCIRDDTERITARREVLNLKARLEAQKA
ncbi:PAS domain S-box protein [Caenimonas koreensis DSM 17982]|uniref:histidine kinase n=2 Tax=Caenimonas TaxID=763439 RepID=A0A844B6I2_9BURK|nr:PAS domain S-box protein [Caenimonas koreensis DSM 17982]